MIKPQNNYTNLAWEFLRRNPKYQVDWQEEFNSQPNLQIQSNSLGIPLLRQSHSDLHVENWGLLVYQDPTTSHTEMSPFWKTDTMVEAEVIPNSERPLLPLLRKLGMPVSGLFLLNGNLILKIENHLTTLQILIKNGHIFSENSSLALGVIFDDQISDKLPSPINFWTHATSDLAKKMILNLRRTIMSFFSLSTSPFLVSPIAR